jgi:hypothetical protein
MAFQMAPDYGTVKGAPDNAVTLFYRDPLKAIQSLLDRSSLAEQMEFAPYRLYRQKDDASQRTRSDDGENEGPDDRSENGSRDELDSDRSNSLPAEGEIETNSEGSEGG